MGNSPDTLNTMKDTFFNVLPFSIILSVILFAAGTILLLFLISKYNNSAYYKRTRLPFFSLFRFSIFGDEDDSESLGYYGEYQIYKAAIFRKLRRRIPLQPVSDETRRRNIGS